MFDVLYRYYKCDQIASIFKAILLISIDSGIKLCYHSDTLKDVYKSSIKRLRIMAKMMVE